MFSGLPDASNPLKRKPSLPGAAAGQTPAKRPSHGPPPPPAAAATPLARTKSAGSRPRTSGSGTPLLTATGVQSARRVFYGNNQQDVGSPGGGGGYGGEPTSYWSVQWRKPQFKKHKTWDGDGILIVRGGKCFLKDENGKDIGSAKMLADNLASGDELRVGGKEVEIDVSIPPQDYISGNCFSSRTAGATPLGSTSAQNLVRTTERVQAPSAGGASSRPLNVLTSAFKPPLPSAVRKPVAFNPPTPVPYRPPQQQQQQQQQQQRPSSLQQVVVKAEPGTSSDVEMHDVVAPPPAAGPSRPRPPASASGTEDDDDDDEGEGMPTATQAIRERIGHLAMRGQATPAPSASASHAPAGPSKASSKSKARFDPTKEGAIVMKRPNRDHQAQNNKKGYDVVDVVLDPKLGDKMREHQKEGVKFLYECVMGLRKVEGNGAILADEMGLGKTLQTIALCWTLLKQNPYADPHRQGVVGKVLIVCPVSLTTNWSKEFRKWLGRDALGVFLGDGDKSQIRQFANSRRHQVLIIGYEKLRTVMDDLRSCQPPIGLIICDEGHRLKSKDAKTSKMFDQLSTKRRVILSGTPLQNDLGEFWSMVDFINPGILDTYPTFNKIYEKPIIKSRAPGCNRTDLELGQGRSTKLSEISRQFILRRTAEVISKYLPPKREYVVFVAPTALQLEIFRELLKQETVQQFVRNSGPGSKSSGGPQPLSLILYARIICNSPMLFKKDEEKLIDTASNAIKKARAIVPDDRSVNDITTSGKLIAVSNILSQIKETTDEKVVIVSNFTKALDVLEALCRLRKYNFERLDGSTAQAKRQDMVDRFNRASQTQSFVFLLSSKSGGAGLNLIGASRLIMLDCDWNPSTDQQAMARIHRDGQKRNVFIYRLLTVGTIDEKMFQRQVTKLGLSGSVMNHDEGGSKGGGAADAFTKDELKALFTIETKTACATHDLLGCDCLYEVLEDDNPAPASLNDSADDGESPDEEHAYLGHPSNRPKPRKKSDAKKAQEKEDKLAVLKEWSHIQCVGGPPPSKVQDAVLLSLIRGARRDHDQADDGGDDAGSATASDDDASAAPPAPAPAPDDVDSPAPPSPPQTLERELSWTPSPPPQQRPPSRTIYDDDGGPSPHSSPRRGLDDFLDDDRMSSPEQALAVVRPAPVKGKGKAREKLFMAGSDSETGEAASRAPGRPRGANGGGKWTSAVDMYRMAGNAEGGRICFLFEKTSLGAD